MGFEVIGEIEGDSIGSEAVGMAKGNCVGTEAVGEKGDVVGSGVVGEIELVGSGVIGEIEVDSVVSKGFGDWYGDSVGSEVVGEMGGDSVGSDVVGACGASEDGAERPRDQGDRDHRRLPGPAPAARAKMGPKGQGIKVTEITVE